MVPCSVPNADYLIGHKLVSTCKLQLPESCTKLPPVHTTRSAHLDSLFHAVEIGQQNRQFAVGVGICIRQEAHRNPSENPDEVVECPSWIETMVSK